jgi:DegV family protein with EDD domain
VIGLCTDSNAQLPSSLIDRFSVEVVPVTVRIGEDEYLEGVDLDADMFYAHFKNGSIPDVSTSQPSPGQFALAYERLAERGATEILSVHIGSAVSGTINAARLACRQSPVPVRLVDTGTASFGVGCCTWAAGDAIASGATIDDAAHAAEGLAARMGNVFIVRTLDVLRRGGPVGESLDGRVDGVPLLSLIAGSVEVVGAAPTTDDAVEAMARYVLDSCLAHDDVINVAVGTSDPVGCPIGDALEAALVTSLNVGEVVRLRLGPSVGAHTGPGTVGVFFYPRR